MFFDVIIVSLEQIFFVSSEITFPRNLFVCEMQLTIKCQYCLHIETSQLICAEN